MKDAEYALTCARISLLLHNPLIGQMVVQIQPKPVTWCSTAATDGQWFYYNPDFIMRLTRDELVFLCAHEVYHCLLEHIFRRGNRDKGIWNMAVDYIVNDALIKANIGKMPEGGLYKPEYSSDDLSAEELYTLLEKTVVTIEVSLDMHLDPDGGSHDGDDGPPNLTEEQIQDIQNIIRSTFLQSAQQVDAGKIPAGLQRLIDRLTASKIDWRHMLDTVLRSTIKHDYTYTRMSRRYSSGDIILPGQDVMDRVVAVAFLDGSGSTTQEMITDFLSECKGIMSTFRDFELTVASFDTEVYNVMIYTPENADDIDGYAFHGEGGTAPSCCWDYLRDHDILPHRLLIFTDGLVGDDWGVHDEHETLFIIHSNPQITAPYGTTVHYTVRLT